MIRRKKINKTKYVYTDDTLNENWINLKEMQNRFKNNFTNGFISVRLANHFNKTEKTYNTLEKLCTDPLQKPGATRHNYNDINSDDFNDLMKSWPVYSGNDL